MSSVNIKELEIELLRLVEEIEKLSSLNHLDEIRKLELPTALKISFKGLKSKRRERGYLSKVEMKALRKDREFQLAINKYSELYLRAWGFDLIGYKLLLTFDPEIEWDTLPEILLHFWYAHLVFNTGYRDSIEKFVYKLYRRKLAFRGKNRKYMKEMGVSKYPLILRILGQILILRIGPALAAGAAIAAAAIKK